MTVNKIGQPIGCLLSLALVLVLVVEFCSDGKEKRLISGKEGAVQKHTRVGIDVHKGTIDIDQDPETMPLPDPKLMLNGLKSIYYVS